MDDERVRAATTAALGMSPTRVTRLHGGANNVVARIDVDGRALVAKLYFSHQGDPRDRLGTEFGMLSFLWRCGLRRIPEPVAMDRNAGVGIYGLLAGGRLTPPVTWLEGLALVELLGEMRGAARPAEARELPLASDASFDVRGRMAELHGRPARLRAASSGDVGAFVEGDLGSAVEDVCNWVEGAAPLLDIDIDEEIDQRERTLSPGDIGFHNVLRDEKDGVSFLDFEYGGWDDVAHVAAQACLAPEVPLTEDMHVPLLRELLKRLAARDAARRLRLLYPLLAVKWSLIVLNDVLAVDGERRAFAGVDAKERRVAQLRKSRILLDLWRASTSRGSALDALLAPPWLSRLSG